MSISLSTALKDYVIEFRAENRNDSPRESIRITTAQAEALNAALKKGAARYIDLVDDEGFYRETLETRLIRGIRKYDTEFINAGMSAVCEFGTRHPHKGKVGFEECTCGNKFKVPPVVFKRLVREKFEQVEYASDITEFMQKDMEYYLNKIL